MRLWCGSCSSVDARHLSARRHPIPNGPEINVSTQITVSYGESNVVDELSAQRHSGVKTRNGNGADGHMLANSQRSN